MDINTLKRILNEHLTTGAGGIKTLTISPTLLQSSVIETLFTRYLNSNSLIIKSTESLDETNQKITFLGTSEHVLFSRMTVTAEFSIQNGEAALLLDAQPDSGWTFANSFPGLTKTFFSQLKFGENTHLYLASHSIQSQIPVGLSFTGTLQLSKNFILNFVDWLLGGEGEVIVSGKIQLENGNPILRLISAPQTEKVELGFYQLPGVQLELLTFIVPETEALPERMSAIANVLSSISFNAKNKPITIPLTATSYLNSPWVQFNTNLDNTLESSFENLSSLVDGLDLSSVLPQQLPIQDQISLSSITLQVDLANRKLETVLVGIESKKSWELLEDVISLEKVFLSFRLDNSASSKKLSLMVSGEFGIN